MRVWYCLIQSSFFAQFLLCGIVYIQYRKNWHNFIFNVYHFHPWQWLISWRSYLGEEGKDILTLFLWRLSLFPPFHEVMLLDVCFGLAPSSVLAVAERQGELPVPPAGLCTATAQLLMWDAAETHCFWLWHITHHFWERDWSFQVNYFSSKVVLLFCVMILWFSNCSNSF